MIRLARAFRPRPRFAAFATLVAAGALGAGALGASAIEPAPPAPRQPVVDEYQGIKVTDDYRWLEKADDPAVKAWVAAENHRTRSYLDGLPGRPEISAQLKAMFGKVISYPRLVSRPGRLFALKFAPPKQQDLLVVMPSATESAAEKVILDPNDLEPKGGTTIDWFVPSPDGQIVAVSLSQGGSEDGTLYFYKTDTGERLPDHIPRVQYPTGGGSLAWRADGKGVYYTRYPSPGERPDADLHFYQQVYLHLLGAPEKEDRYAFGKDLPRIAEIALQAARGGAPGVLAIVKNGDGGELAVFLLTSTDGTWHQIAGFKDNVKDAGLGNGESAVYLRSVQDAPRGKILRLPFSGDRVADLKGAAVIVPEKSDSIIENFAVGRSHLYVTDLVGGPSRLRTVDLDGKNEHEIPLPPVSGIVGLVPVSDPGAGAEHILFRQSSYVAPAAWFLFGPTPAAPAGEAVKTALGVPSPVDFSDIEVVREFAPSKDGTKVPMNILRRKGTKLDGSNPTLLYGYGGYGVNETPYCDTTLRLWFDRGGVFVDSNLRGGGEYGEEWHLKGNLTLKQNVFDDFAACAEYLIKTGYTNSGKLAVLGGSNGGLLMGAFLTQHPDLARAVVSQVGIYDMLRVEHDPNGSFNVTEFGTVKDAAQFKALYAYSPYHHVTDGTKYPAVLFMTGDNDGRVDPYHSRKMMARLQAASGSDRPLLLRTTAAGGHGIGTALDEKVAEDTDWYSFLFDQLGMKAPATAAATK